MTKARDLSIGIPNGLVLIKPTGATNGTVNDSGTVTIGNAVTSVEVTGAFSATYDAYRIVITGGVGSDTTSGKLTLGATATGYYSGVHGIVYSSSVGSQAGYNNAASWVAAFSVDANSINGVADLGNPFASKYTTLNTTGHVTTTLALVGGGYLANTTSYTSFTITAGTGTLTGGTISIYGYRK